MLKLTTLSLILTLVSSHTNGKAAASLPGVPNACASLEIIGAHHQCWWQRTNFPSIRPGGRQSLKYLPAKFITDCLYNLHISFQFNC